MGNVIQIGLILVFAAGACLGSPIHDRLNSEGKSCTVACMKKRLDPVCGSDGRTYKNPCMLNAQNCGRSTKVVEELYEGVCSADPTETRCQKLNAKILRCPEKIDPLCGEDKHTYLNYCELLKLNCEQKIGIGVIHRGACDADLQGAEKKPEITTAEQTTLVTEASSTSQVDESSSGVVDTEATTENPIIDDIFSTGPPV